MVLILLLLCLGGCFAVPQEVPVVAQVETSPVEVPLPSCPAERVIMIEPLPTARPIQTLIAPRGKPTNPLEVIKEAHQTARVEPTLEGYRGGSVEQHYAWSPGKVYTIYLNKRQATGVFLPPGETLASGLYLDGEAFEVKTERAGTGEQAYDAILVRPLEDTGQVDTFLLTTSGRRYILHLVVGKQAMVGVQFTTKHP